MSHVEHTEQNDNTNWFGLILLFAVVWFAYTHFAKKDIWMGFYESTADRRIYTSQEFYSANTCSAWLAQERQRERLYPSGRYNFECGMSCKPPTTINGPYVCEKTFDN